MIILAGDIGGTKTILAAFSSELGPRRPLQERSYPSQQHASLEAIISDFLDEFQQPVEMACFGVAGPVVLGSARITNLSWVVDGERIRTAFNWRSVTLLNDLESVACAIPVLEAQDLHTLSAGKPVRGGSIAVLAPGTGLGEGFLTFENSSYHAHASEGGHTSFGPVGSLQIGLLEYMNAQGHRHVSYERVCSGGLGIANLYAYLKKTGLQEPGWLAQKLAESQDPTPVIFSAAQDASQPCELARTTVELFVAILGAEAGNLALKVLATGGITLGGGIPPRILPQLQEPAFLEALRSKGRFRPVLTDMPVHVILNPKAGLLGAASYGLNHSSE